MKYLLDMLGIERGTSFIFNRSTDIFHNGAGDFTATPILGTSEIFIQGLPFILEAQLIASIHTMSHGSWNNVELNCTVYGNIINLNNEPPFEQGDTAFVHLTGPNKSWQ